MKSRKWSARNRTAQDKICRVWEERGAEYARLQQRFEETEEARRKKARERREMEAAQVGYPRKTLAVSQSVSCRLRAPLLVDARAGTSCSVCRD